MSLICDIGRERVKATTPGYFIIIISLYYPTLGKFIMSPEKKRKGSDSNLWPHVREVGVLSLELSGQTRRL
jgi:hypothetical protein